MRTFKATLRLDASGPTVWREMADVTRWPQWMPTFTSVEAFDAAELAVGRRFKATQPKLRPAIWTVTRLSDAAFSWESRSPGLKMTADHSVESSINGTLLRLEFHLDGWLAPVIGRLWGKLIQEYLERECAACDERTRKRAMVAS